MFVHRCASLSVCCRTNWWPGSDSCHSARAEASTTTCTTQSATTSSSTGLRTLETFPTTTTTKVTLQFAPVILTFWPINYTTIHVFQGGNICTEFQLSGCVQIMESHGKLRNFKFKFSRPGKSWKVMENKPNGCRISDPCTWFQPLHTLSLYAVRLGSICCYV